METIVSRRAKLKITIELMHSMKRVSVETEYVTAVAS